MGFPVDIFPVMFAIPRMSGWLAQWKEGILDDRPEDREAEAESTSDLLKGIFLDL